jgi:hypothetical protein
MILTTSITLDSFKDPIGIDSVDIAKAYLNTMSKFKLLRANITIKLNSLRISPLKMISIDTINHTIGEKYREIAR